MEITEIELQKRIDDAIATAVSGLKDNRDETLSKLAKAKQDLADIEKQKADELEAAEQAKLLEAGNHDALLKRVRETHSTEMETLRSQLQTANTIADKATTDLRSLLVDKGLSDLYVGAGVTNPHLLSAIVASNAKKAVIEDDTEGNPVVKIDGQALTEYIEAWKTTDEGKSFITSGNSGGGSGGDGGGSTDDWEQYFKPETRNLTKQSELGRIDPDRYKVLKEQHSPKTNVLPLSAGQGRY